MKSPTNRDLFAYWNERRGNRAAPVRADIEPNAIRHLLGDSFFLSADATGNYPFRLAGTRLCALFGRELKNDTFLRLWDKAEQVTMRKLLDVVVEEQAGLVAQVIGHTSDGSPLVVNLELLLLPLLPGNAFDSRVLGSLTPMSVPHWFGARVLGPLKLGMLRHVGRGLEQGPSLIPAAKAADTQEAFELPAGGQLKRGFVVYQGGRSE